MFVKYSYKERENQPRVFEKLLGTESRLRPNIGFNIVMERNKFLDTSPLTYVSFEFNKIKPFYLKARQTNYFFNYLRDGK